MTISNAAPIFSALMLFSLFDFYLPGAGLRPLDLLGLVILTISGLWWANRGGFNAKGNGLPCLFLLALLDFILVLEGSVADPANLKIGIGFLLGTTVLLLTYSARISRHQLRRVTEILLIINFTYLFVQWSYYYMTGSVLNLYFIVGVEPRALSSIFRPTGLFLEPASYSVSVLMLLALRTKLYGRWDRISYVTLFSILLTVSLWGFVAVFIFLAFFKWKDWRFWVIVATLVALVIFIFSGYGWLQEFQLYRRLAGLDPDTSRDVRFGGLASILQQSAVPLLFGKGVSNDYLALGSNSFSFLVSAGGILGSGAFIFLLYILAARVKRVQTMFFLALFMSAAPFWPYFYWWAWLGLYLRGYDRHDDSIGEEKLFLPDPDHSK